MAIFGKKKLSLDEILKGIDELSPEEQEKVKSKMQDLYKAEDEREIDKIEEEKTDDTEVKDEKAEEVTEESEEIGKDVNEVKSEVEGEKPTAQPKEQAEATETTEEVEKTVPTDTPPDTTQDKKAEENAEVSLTAVMERITGIEEKLAEFGELKQLMEEFTTKQAKEYGYTGAIPGAKKDMRDMSSKELKEGILRGEY